MSVLAVVPARSGSKGIERKNIRPFCGRPLLDWAVACALSSRVVDRVVASTDDEEIAAVARRAGAEVPFLRPAELATDEAPTAAVVRHALEFLEQREGWLPDYVAVLEPTSPGRTPRHVDEALELLKASGAESVASVSEVPHHYAPTKQLALGADGRIAGLDGTPIERMTHRRQELPVAFAFDGIVFACMATLPRRDPPTVWGADVVGYRVDHSHVVDLDRPDDWEPAEAKLRAALA